MIDLTAIDPPFLTRFLFGIVFLTVLGWFKYWVSGLFTKGAFEKIQSHYGGLLFGFSNNKIQELKRYANSTCTQIDDILINPVADIGDRLNRIVNRDDLSPAEQRLHRQLIDADYKLSILLSKLGVSNGNDQGL